MRTIAQLRFISLVPVLTLAAMASCTRGETGSDTTGATAGATTGMAAGQKVGETTGFDTPESVRYDAELDVYFVSNINGNPSQKDNNGWIARVHPDSLGSVTRLVEGGRNGVTLHAPKGMALKGDTLFVADIDAVRMFNRRTGAPIGSVSLTSQRATFLNDVATGPDGVYITDTGITFDAQGNMSHPNPDRIFRLVGRTATEAFRGDTLGRPNGIAWDSAGGRFIVLPFGSNALMAWTPGSSTVTTLVSGPGQFDGIEIVSDGVWLVSSWADSTVHVVHGGGHMMPAIRNVAAPADIGVDSKRRLVAVPLFNNGKVEYYRIP